MTTTAMREVPLKDLKFGHELPNGGINDRVTGRDSMIAELAANIAAHGLLQPIAAWLNGTSGKGEPPYYVLAGNRRLAALKLLAKKNAGVQAAPNVLMIEAMDVNEALDKALSSNLYVPPHPVDRFESFARLVDGGMVEKAIASTYGLELKEVQQALALGKLAPEIRKAWRDGKLSPEVAKTFTLEPDQKRQADIYAKLKKAHNLYGAHSVRAAIIGDSNKLGAMLKYVTPAAYKDAGGTIRVDLFAEDDDPSAIPTDAAKLKKLADDKLDAECAKLTKAGWKWASRIDSVPPNAHYMWAKTGNGAKSSAADKAKSGCVVGVNYEGKLEIHYGLLKPGDAKAVAAGKEPAAEKPKKAKADPKALSSALEARLDTQVALAVQDVLHAAEAGNLGRAACIMLASMITPERMSWSSVKIDDVRYLRDTEAPKVMVHALLERFDAKDYFASIPTALIKKIIKDEFGDPALRAGAGKTELAELAATLAKGKWLPIQMRQAAPKPTKKAKRK